MKQLLVTLAVASAACAAPVLAADVGISISLGEPGFYGQIDIGDYGRPRVVNAQPILVERRYRNLAPVYLRVPVKESRNWRKYCDRYNACTRPVYFVRDDWYRDVYVPRYREKHGHDRHDDHDRHDRDRH